MSSKFIGRDVSVFAVQVMGTDTAPASGDTISYLGRWESFEITLTNEWSTVTSSDADQPEKRYKMADFSGSIKTWIDTGGSHQLLTFGAAKLIYMVFTNVNDGKTMFCRAGIKKVHAMWNGDHGKDDLEFEDVGRTAFGGLSTFGYA